MASKHEKYGIFQDFAEGNPWFGWFSDVAEVVGTGVALGVSLAQGCFLLWRGAVWVEMRAVLGYIWRRIRRFGGGFGWGRVVVDLNQGILVLTVRGDYG